MIDSVNVSLPPLFVAVTVYDAVLVIPVGVPLINPCSVSSDRPAGRDGLTLNDTTAPPEVKAGKLAAMATSLVYVGDATV